MSYDNWLNDPYIKKWLGKKSERTKQNYIARFPKWLAFIKMTPAAQIEKRVKDLQSSDLMERTWFEDKVIEYKNFLQTQYEKEDSVKAYMTAPRSFFSSNRLPLNFGRGELKVEVDSKVIEQEWVPSNIEIRVMYGQANVRDRALLLVLYQSGFSEIDVSSLNIEDLNDIFNNERHLFIEKKREKTNQIQATCISAEAVHDIKAMLQERGKPQKGVLFVSPKGQRLSVRFINEAMKKLAKTAYPDKPFKTKNLRSSYNSALLRANIQPQELKDILMGHKRRGARSHYAYDKITILEAYEKAFKYLSINHGTQTKKSLEKIENSIIGLSEIVTKQQARIEGMEEEIDEQRNRIIEQTEELIKANEDIIKANEGMKLLITRQLEQSSFIAMILHNRIKGIKVIPEEIDEEEIKRLAEGKIQDKMNEWLEKREANVEELREWLGVNEQEYNRMQKEFTDIVDKRIADKQKTLRRKQSEES